jgi:hypothetical protein
MRNGPSMLAAPATVRGSDLVLRHGESRGDRYKNTNPRGGLCF